MDEKSKQRLITYIKLANHNNSDGEANSAARRVCKMIEEDGFEILGQQVVQTKKRTYDSPFTQNDVRRSPEPEFKSKVYEPPPYATYTHAYDDVKEFTEKDFEDLLKNIKNIKYKPVDNPFHTFYGGGRAGKSSWVDEQFRRGASKQEKPNRLLKCRTCGRESFTKFQGRDEFYECAECWNPENRKEPK